MAAAGFELVPYPKTPLEQLYADQPRNRGLKSKHTRAVRAFGVIIIVSVGGLLLSYGFKLIQSAELLATVLTVLPAAVAWLYQLGKQRFSTVDIFSSEIAARIRTLAVDNSVARIIASVEPVPTSSNGSLPNAPIEKGDNIDPSQENQFENFHRRSADLGALSSTVLDHATAFYSYQMAARDELRVLRRATSPEMARVQVVNVIFMVDLMALSAIQVLDELIETDAHRVYCRQLALCVGTAANAYLIANVDPDDRRFNEIRMRNEAYAEFIKGLKADLRRLKPGLSVRLGRNRTQPIRLHDGFL